LQSYYSKYFDLMTQYYQVFGRLLDIIYVLFLYLICHKIAAILSSNLQCSKHKMAPLITLISISG
jgi:hypothetical protein